MYILIRHQATVAAGVLASSTPAILNEHGQRRRRRHCPSSRATHRQSLQCCRRRRAAWSEGCANIHVVRKLRVRQRLRSGHARIDRVVLGQVDPVKARMSAWEALAIAIDVLLDLCINERHAISAIRAS